MQTHSWNEMGWLAGWLVCLFVLFHNEEIQWPPLFVSQCENLLQNKTLKYKIGFHHLSLAEFSLYIVLFWFWFWFWFGFWFCCRDEVACEMQSFVRRILEFVSWVTAQLWRRKQKSGINRMSMMEIRKLLLQSPLNCSDSVSFFPNFFSGDL